MSLENSAGLGVNNYYGPRVTEDGVQAGAIKTEGVENELVLFITDENYASVTGSIPAGAIITEAFAVVTEAFAFTGGTSPTMDIGTDTSEATNGTGLDLTSTGTEAGTLAGTWAAPLAAATTVGVATSGSPTSVDAGQAKVVIRYQYTN
jgi:hypothetical protein